MRQRFIRSPPNEQVDVIGHSANLQQQAALIAHDSTNESVEARLQFRCDPCLAVFGGKHDVESEVGVGSTFRLTMPASGETPHAARRT